MSKTDLEPATFNKKGVMVHYFQSRKLVKIWTTNPTVASVFLEKLISSKKIGNVTAIFLYDPNNLAISSLLRGAEMIKFIKTRPEITMEIPKPSFKDLANNQAESPSS